MSSSTDECVWCPLCRLAEVMRTENPDALAKVIVAAAAFAEAIRQLFEPDPSASPPSSAASKPRPESSPVEHIHLHTEPAG